MNKDESLSPWEKIDKLVDFYVDKALDNLRFHNIMYQQANTTRSEDIKNRVIAPPSNCTQRGSDQKDDFYGRAAKRDCSRKWMCS